nr:polyribonucleotide nucleotidyltransferase 2, mitochondrial-like [Physcomitrium patens]XP_024369531.1 polyribonucleotide nucleotidyltransferase 2, mitochondrial-like [Physcomitrium patens]|eukprot:XP_024369524.1 polyribonucleotide nucleotidyltransferase 2, mitochondrial-like [Physcomitrella patens]
MMLRRRGVSSIVRAVDASWRWRCAQIQSFQSIESSNTASDERALQRHIHGRSVSNFSTVGEPCLIAAPEVPSVWRTFLASGQVFQEEVVVGEVKVSFETGKLARFAAGAVVVRVGETKVLVTVVADHKLDAGKDFLSLQVEYREKQYAQGKISATFMRREGAPKERELLCGRLIDRSVRPLFPRSFFYDSQIIANVLCSDGEQDPDVLAVNAASAALMLSDIPWKGPIGCVRIGRVKGKFIVNPNMDELSVSDLNLVYACTTEKTVMIETQAREITNQDYIAALHLAHAETTKLIPPQLELAAKVAVHKRPLPVLNVPPEVLEKVRSLAEVAIEPVMGNPLFGKFERCQTLGKIEEDVRNVLVAESDEVSVKLLPYAFDAVKKEVMRRNIFDKGIRVDGRGLNQVRELQCDAGTYPSLHGSSLFSRGNTQVLCTVTMGTPDDAQRLDSLVGVDRKRFMVHYSFPPFSINEVGRTVGLNRREVGHGTLAEKALVALLPPEEDFPYSVRVTSECLASDGSSSMATVCGGSLALMDAGIHLRSHVGAVSVGLVSVSDPATGRVTDYRILTDILGLEDHLGDMDFKIAGTKKGVTAVQLDIKPAGIPLHILCEALEPALVGLRAQTLRISRELLMHG